MDYVIGELRGGAEVDEPSLTGRGGDLDCLHGSKTANISESIALRGGRRGGFCHSEPEAAKRAPEAFQKTFLIEN